MTMEKAWLYVVPLVAVAWNSAYSAPQAAPSAVSIKRFKSVPVEMASGELVQREGPDLSLKSRGMLLEVGRNYRSRREAKSIFGYGWSWNHADHLEFPGDLVINYVSGDTTIPIFPDVSYTSAYARVCLSAPGWSGGEMATGAPDAIGGYGNVAHYYGPIGSLQPLVVGGWNFQSPDGASTILQVDLASIGATAYDSDHPQYGVSLKLSAGGARSVVWGHRAYDFDAVDITSDRASWTWSDLNAIQARVELASCLQNVEMDAIVDTVHVGVTYTRNASGEYKYLPGTTFEVIKTDGEYRILNKNRTELAFGLDGKLLRKTDANGNALSFHYDQQGRLAHIADAVHQSLGLTYENSQPDAKVTAVTDHLGRRVSYAYEGDDLVGVTNVLGDVVRYTYSKDQTAPELSHNMTTRTDPEGHSVAIDYHTTNSTPDRVWRYRDGEVSGGISNAVCYLYLKGTTYSYMPGTKCIQGVVYNASNDISQVYLREGELTYQESDGVNLVAGHAAQSVGSPQTSRWENIESATGLTDGLMAHNAALGTNGYLDASNWSFNVPGMSNDIVQVIISVRGISTNPVCLSGLGMTTTNWVATNVQSVALNITGDRSRWTWADISNLTARISLPAGSTNSAEVWIDGVTLQVRYRHFDPGSDPGDTFYFYDLSHNVISTDRGGAVHQFAYDDRGNLTSWINPEGHVRRYDYDPVLNKLIRSWDALGQVTTMAYDGVGRLLKTTDALGHSASLEYDRFGNPIRATDPAGNVETTRYDTNGVHVLSIRNKLGYETGYDYDRYGNCVRITDPCNFSRHTSFNKAGWKESECDENGVVSRFEYDRNGRLTASVKSAGTREETTTRFKSDGRGLSVEMQDSRGNLELMEYDATGRPVCQTDKLGGTTLTDYDLDDNPIRIGDPLGQVTENFCDGRGNIILHFDRRGGATTVAYDGNNQPVLRVDAVGNRVETVYDANGNLLSETRRAAGFPGCVPNEIPEPLTAMYTYDALNRMTRKVIGAGRQDARVYVTDYDSAGRVIQETDPLGNSIKTEFDAEGNRTHISLFDVGGALVSREHSSFDAANRPVTVIKGFGAVTVTNWSDYDACGMKVAVRDGRGNKTLFSYDTHRRLISTTDSLGNVHWANYDGLGNKVREREASGAIAEYAWDAAGRLTNKVIGVGLPEARVTSLVRDLLGRVVRETDPLGYSFSWTYDAEGTVLAETNALGYVKTFVPDAIGRITHTVDEAGGQTGQALDGNGKLRRLTDKTGFVTASEYDVFGNLISLTDALGGKTRWAYDGNDNKIRDIDPRGLVSSLSYDAAGRMTNKTAGVGLADAASSRVVYDALGRVVTSRTPVGGCETRRYDAAGNCITRTDPRGAVTQYSFDALNRETATVDALGGQTGRIYDDRGNTLSMTDALGGTSRSTYDAYNLKRSVTDARGNTTRYQYDRLGRLIATTDPLGGVESRTYDAAGNCVATVDKNGFPSFFAYDRLGRVTNTTDALGYHTRKTYDALGNLLAAYDKRGNGITYQVDKVGRPVAVADPASNTIYFVYDAGGNKIRESLPSGRVTTSGYDGFGRLILKTAGAGEREARQTRYEYDPMGRLIREIDPYGYVIERQYDANGNTTNVTDRRGTSTRMDYDDLNRLIRTIDAMGNSTSVMYDRLGRITGTTNRRGDSTRHDYDVTGRLTAIRDAEGTITSNRYDALGRLCEEVAPNGRRTFMGYDAAGQLTNRSVNCSGSESRSQNTEYDALGRPFRVTDAAGGVTVLDYDPNGNVIQSTALNSAGKVLRSRSTHYDSRNLPFLATDYLGNAWRTEYDSSGRKSADVDPLGNRTETGFNRFDEIVSVTDALAHRTETRYDRCGRKVEVVNPLGQRVRYQYDPNGNRTRVINDNGHAILYAFDALNRVTEVNRTLPSVPLDVLTRADVNGDGRINGDDVVAVEEGMP
jgi:YD repeat-containing protein